MDPKAPTNDPSEHLPDPSEHPTETQSMIIEAGSDALRLDVELDKGGRAIKGSRVQILQLGEPCSIISFVTSFESKY